VLRTISREDKAKVEEFLFRSHIIMHIYPLIEFNYMLTMEEHRNRRNQVIEFEKQIIHLFEQANKNVINHARHQPRQSLGSLFPAQILAVRADFGI
jgi:hypothetical protein